MTTVEATDRFNQLDNVRVDSRTAFILGNGPSLAMVDLHSLSDYATIGLNAAYRHWRSIGWRPRYYACLDLVVGISHKEEIAKLIDEGEIQRFLLRDNLIEALGPTGKNPRVVNYDDVSNKSPFLNIKPITTGSHSALWAASMGYDQIVLLGVDAQYKEIVEGATRRDGIELEIVREGANPNYYFDGYQTTGDRFNLPNPRPELHLTAWRRAARMLRIADFDVFNGNEASGVECFPYIGVDRFLGEGDVPVPAKEPLSELDSETPAPQAPQVSKIRAFLKAYVQKGVLATVSLISLFILWLTIMHPSASLATFAGAGLMIALIMAAGMLYFRFVIIAHLARLEEELKNTHARLKLIENLPHHRRARRRS